MNILYVCDPDKNIKCSKKNCYLKEGPCHLTRDVECSAEFTADTMVFQDSLELMFDMQREFQDRFDPRYKSDDPTIRAAFLRDHFVYCSQELQEMLYEIPFFKHWKDYSKMTNEEIEEAYVAAKKEMVDAWHFFMNLALGLGMDADELTNGYFDKHKENLRRQETGYDHTMKHI